MEILRIGITQGDINGINYELLIKTFIGPEIYDYCVPILYGSSKVLAFYKNILKMPDFTYFIIDKPQKAIPRMFNVINVMSGGIKAEPGQITQIAAHAALYSLEFATRDLMNGHLDILITLPINKKAMSLINFKYTGHTDYLKAKFNVNDVLMFMISENIKIGLLTVHIPLKDVFQYITIENILSKLRIMNKSLMFDFGIIRPIIAILGLNPHAGEDGFIGTEDKEIISIAIEEARKENIFATGPFPADSFFAKNAYKNYDAVLAMYHDQALIPFKMLAFDEGVNFTAGLPYIRVSPAHGTAHDIAERGIANTSSFKNCIFTAIDIYNNRKKYLSLPKNKLEKMPREHTEET